LTKSILVSLGQPLDAAPAGAIVTASFEVGVISNNDTLEFRFERGSLGYSEVTLTELGEGADSEPTTVLWDGGSEELVDGEPGRNP
jgi:hypothetical protein